MEDIQKIYISCQKLNKKCKGWDLGQSLPELNFAETPFRRHLSGEKPLKRALTFGFTIMK